MTTHQPLAARMRPTTLSEVLGQDHLTGDGSPLQLIAQGRTGASVILWGPPGSGKTTIASVIATSRGSDFVELSATSAGVKEVRAVIARAVARHDEGESTVLFLDEIHRFTKAQQDILLPAVESGVLQLIGATTENPHFSVNDALLSRSVLMVLRALGTPDLITLLQRAMDTDKVLQGLELHDEAAETIARLSAGDTRQALGRLETAAQMVLAKGEVEITNEVVGQVAGTALQRYDADGDAHYDVTSALIKSMRGSDPDAALHWLARMIAGGEDPRFIARRLVVHASEDVGMADPSVLPLCVAAAQAVQLIGMPEARINLAQAVVAIATAPKSPAIIRGIDRALDDVLQGRTPPVPIHLRDGHYPGAAALGHGQGYLYPHDEPTGVAHQQYLPDGLTNTPYYEPTRFAHEGVIAGRMAAIRKINPPRGQS